MYEIKADGENLILVSDIDLAQTLDCGQAFRWSESGGVWTGVAKGKNLKLAQRGDEITFFNTTMVDFNEVWRDYFDLDRDYAAIKSAVSANEIIRAAADFAGGIHILRQEPWEAVCSFIISANNNIPRIKGIITRLCESYGENLGDGNYAFPTPQRLSQLTVDDLAPLKSGFRAKYILDAAKKFADGEIDVAALYTLPIDEARAELMKINGVGPKVADCALLFGWSRVECFPVDVWIRRAMERLFGEKGLPDVAKPHAGIVQQYIFHYARTTKLDI